MKKIIIIMALTFSALAFANEEISQDQNLARIGQEVMYQTSNGVYKKGNVVSLDSHIVRLKIPHTSGQEIDFPRERIFFKEIYDCYGNICPGDVVRTKEGDYRYVVQLIKPDGQILLMNRRDKTVDYSDLYLEKSIDQSMFNLSKSVTNPAQYSCLWRSEDLVKSVTNNITKVKKFKSKSVNKMLTKCQDKGYELCHLAHGPQYNYDSTENPLNSLTMFLGITFERRGGFDKGTTLGVELAPKNEEEIAKTACPILTACLESQKDSYINLPGTDIRRFTIAHYMNEFNCN